MNTGTLISFTHPRDEILEGIERIYRNRMTTTSGGNLSIREENGDIWITPARVPPPHFVPKRGRRGHYQGLPTTLRSILNNDATFSIFAST